MYNTDDPCWGWFGSGTGVRSRIAIKGLVVPLIFLWSLNSNLTLTSPSNKATLANLSTYGCPHSVQPAWPPHPALSPASHTPPAAAAGPRDGTPALGHEDHTHFAPTTAPGSRPQPECREEAKLGGGKGGDSSKREPEWLWDIHNWKYDLLFIGTCFLVEFSQNLAFLCGIMRTYGWVAITQKVVQVLQQA